MVYGGQLGCMFGAWNYMVGNFNYGDQPGCMVGAWIFMVRQFCCMEINPSSMEVKYGVCLLHGIMW